MWYRALPYLLLLVIFSLGGCEDDDSGDGGILPIEELSYRSSDLVLSIDSEMAEVVADVNNRIATFSINPSLPNGLVFDTENGSISGTPQTLLDSTAYTITAKNSASTVTTKIYIAVREPRKFFLVGDRGFIFDISNFQNILEVDLPNISQSREVAYGNSSFAIASSSLYLVDLFTHQVSTVSGPSFLGSVVYGHPFLGFTTGNGQLHFLDTRDSSLIDIDTSSSVGLIIEFSNENFISSDGSTFFKVDTHQDPLSVSEFKYSTTNSNSSLSQLAAGHTLATTKDLAEEGLVRFINISDLSSVDTASLPSSLNDSVYGNRRFAYALSNGSVLIALEDNLSNPIFVNTENNPTDIAFGNNVFCSIHTGANVATLIDASSNLVSQTIELNFPPRAIGFGDRFFVVTTTRTIAVIDSISEEIVFELVGDTDNEVRSIAYSDPLQGSRFVLGNGGFDVLDSNSHSLLGSISPQIGAGVIEYGSSHYFVASKDKAVFVDARTNELSSSTFDISPIVTGDERQVVFGDNTFLSCASEGATGIELTPVNDPSATETLNIVTNTRASFGNNQFALLDYANNKVLFIDSTAPYSIRSEVNLSSTPEQITFGNDLFAITLQDGQVVLIDANNYTSRIINVIDNIDQIAFGNEQFLVVQFNDIRLIDSNTFEVVNIPLDTIFPEPFEVDIAFGNNRFFVVGANTEISLIVDSTDKQIFRRIDNTISSITAVKYGNGRFVIANNVGDFQVIDAFLGDVMTTSNRGGSTNSIVFYPGPGQE